MRKIPVGTAQPRGLAAFKTVQKKVQRGRAEAQARQDFVSIPLKIGCITMWAIAGLFLFSLMRPAAFQHLCGGHQALPAGFRDD